MARYRYNPDTGTLYEVGDPEHDPKVHLIMDNAKEDKGYLWHPGFDEHEQGRAYFSSKSKYRAETKARGFEETGGRNPETVKRERQEYDNKVQAKMNEAIIRHVKSLNLRNP